MSTCINPQHPPTFCRKMQKLLANARAMPSGARVFLGCVPYMDHQTLQWSHYPFPKSRTFHWGRHRRNEEKSLSLQYSVDTALSPLSPAWDLRGEGPALKRRLHSTWFKIWERRLPVTDRCEMTDTTTYLPKVSKAHPLYSVHLIM